MITMPDFDKAFDYENAFYQSCDPMRMAKAIAHYEFFRRTQDLPGALVECGVFRGCSLARFAMFREIFGNAQSRKIVAFDMFDVFPDRESEPDKKGRDRHVALAGGDGISVEQMREVLAHKQCDRNVDLVPGDICETVPRYVAENPHLKISLLNLDTDVHDPAVTILEHLYPRIVPGGILILDDYATYAGETNAVDDHFKDQDVKIQKLSFSMTPCYVVKE